MRKMNSITTASQMNKNARAHCEQYCMELKKVIEFDVRAIHIDEDGHGKDSNSLPNVLNPPRSRQKGVRNKRLKSTVEKKCDQLKRRKSKKLLKTDVGSSSAQPQVMLKLIYYLCFFLWVCLVFFTLNIWMYALFRFVIFYVILKWSVTLISML